MQISVENEKKELHKGKIQNKFSHRKVLNGRQHMEVNICLTEQSIFIFE